MIEAIDNIPEVSLRQLKSALHVANTRSVTRAAETLNRSQTAVTKAINDLEKVLDRRLFDRSSTGMQPTVYGEAITKRVAQAVEEFSAAGRAYLKYNPNVKNIGNNPLFSMDISHKRAAAFIALYELRNISAAALELGVTKTAIYNSVRQIEDLLGSSLFEREPNGVSPTAYCKVLAQHIKLAFAELRRGIEDIRNIDGIHQGRLTIGTLPYTRTVLTPRAINQLLNNYPELDVSTREGPYQAMEVALCSGEIDCIVGALRTDSANNDIVTEELLSDKLSVIARKGHPLTKKRRLSLAALQESKWVLPAMNTPARKLFDEQLTLHNMQPPTHCIETSSISMVRGLLLESDRLALISEHQIHYDKQYQLLEVLPVDLSDTTRPIGVTMLKRNHPSPALGLFLEYLRRAASDVKKIV